MKKEYITPDIEAVDMDIANPFCTSNDPDPNKKDTELLQPDGTQTLDPWTDENPWGGEADDGFIFE